MNGLRSYARFIRGPKRGRLRWIESTSGCWLWVGAIDGHGYGSLKIDGRTWKANCWSWVVFVGPIPPGAHVLHRCDVKRCIRPQHLYLGDHADNMRDLWSGSHAPRGARNGAAKLSKRDVLRVFALRARGWTQRRIGDSVGVDQAVVSRILAGLSYREESGASEAAAA